MGNFGLYPRRFERNKILVTFFLKKRGVGARQRGGGDGNFYFLDFTLFHTPLLRIPYIRFFISFPPPRAQNPFLNFFLFQLESSLPFIILGMGNGEFK